MFRRLYVSTIIMISAMDNMIKRITGSMAKMKIEKCFDFIAPLFRAETRDNNLTGF